MHSELIRLGFLEYVAAIGRGPLFPEVTPASRGGGRAHTFAKRFPAISRARTKHLRNEWKASRPRVTARDRRNPGVDRNRAALVGGHERGFTFRVYNPEGLDVTMLPEVVELVRYEGLELG